MHLWQIILIMAAVWLVAMLVFCVACWPRIARRLRRQHHAPAPGRDSEAPR